VFLAKQANRSGERTYTYWVLKRTVWDKTLKRTRQQYICSIGRKRTITREQAQHISQEKGVPMEELERVKRLRIIENEKVAA